ncbi:MAG: hypothetical protein R2805_04820 [Flavobacterium sp.]
MIIIQFAKLFEDERTCFGSYISKDFEKSRLKIRDKKANIII